MKILVIGSGAREHAILWKLKQSKKVSKLFCAPGNAGISQIAECVNLSVDNISGLLEFAKTEKIELTVVGPEVPLVLGIVDRFKEVGLKIFGPDSKGAILEGSKAFSKEFMMKYKIPTAKYHSFTEADRAIEALKEYTYPLVIKADGLAAGKGVLICQTREEAVTGINEILTDKKFGDAGNSLVVEEFLEGIEASLLCFVAGDKIIPMESARDYKRAHDNDQGLNTGGMGSFSPNTVYTPILEKEIEENILNPIIKGFLSEKIDFRGVLFIGLMMTKNGVKVLEFNVRMGDPETEVVLPRLESDLVEIFEKTIEGTLQKSDLSWKKEVCLTVIAASGGYPEDYEKGKVISGLEKVDSDIIVFHAGTALKNGEIVNNGGRVLAVTALGYSFTELREKIYKNMERIHFDKMFYRTDIAKL